MRHSRGKAVCPGCGMFEACCEGACGVQVEQEGEVKYQTTTVQSDLEQDKIRRREDRT